jgi:hypothetical protein
MKRLALILLLGSVLAFAPEPAAAQDPGATVTGHDRVICRRITRTASRMRTGRICRPMSQWRQEAGGNSSPDEPYTTADGAADSLTVGDGKISTNCIGGEMTRANGRTPLGPR